MASPHVALPSELGLPPHLEDAQRFLERWDPLLRLRRSAETGRFYVLERRCRRQTINHLGSRTLSDAHVQARDGYIHVSLVHPQLALRPWVIVERLQTEGIDLFASSAAQVSSDLEYEEAWMRETRRRRRLQLYRDVSSEAFDTLARLGEGPGRVNRTRFSNPGVLPH
ncbi:MAG: hypothetical protein IT181_13170 [Acidobacteria bacterium]|nr:hypothetical protein [Acidobacteriota bacterium]